MARPSEPDAAPLPVVEHIPWRGCLYEDGLRGERIAICGYSHYSDHGDHNDLTRHIVGDVVSGAARYNFFTSIAGAFGQDNASLWPRVVFFNFVPAIVGTGGDKFAIASSAENERARARFWRILDEHRPSRLFVFSKKAWEACPNTDEERAGVGLRGADVQSGSYTLASGHRLLASGSRHPQGAAAADLRATVERAFA